MDSDSDLLEAFNDAHGLSLLDVIGFENRLPGSRSGAPAATSQVIIALAQYRRVREAGTPTRCARTGELASVELVSAGLIRLGRLFGLCGEP